jgi:hypothetical protein
MCLLTPHNLGTRIDPSTGKPTIIDLTLAPSSLATSSNITTTQHMGSDHLPLTMLLNESPARNTRQNINDKKWSDWNALIDETLQDANFHSLSNPTEVSSTFYKSIEYFQPTYLLIHSYKTPSYPVSDPALTISSTTPSLQKKSIDATQIKKLSCSYGPHQKHHAEKPCSIEQKPSSAPILYPPE